jgi:hypothetical protein
MTNSQLIPFLLASLIGVCVYYFKKLDTKIDNLTDSKYSHDTEITVIKTRLDIAETDIKFLKQYTK